MRLCHPVPEGKARMAASFFFFLHFYCVRCMADVLRASHSAPFGANRSLPCGVAAQPVRRGLLQELVMGAHASAAVILFAWCINTHSLWQSFEVRSRKAAGAPRPHVCHAAQLSLACAGTRAHLRPDLPTSAPGLSHRRGHLSLRFCAVAPKPIIGLSVGRPHLPWLRTIQ